LKPQPLATTAGIQQAAAKIAMDALLVKWSKRLAIGELPDDKRMKLTGAREGKDAMNDLDDYQRSEARSNWRDYYNKMSSDLGAPEEPETDKERARQAIAAELGAINLYDQLAAKTENPDLKETLEDVAQEEKVHMGEFLQRLNKIDLESKPSIQQGEREAEKDSADAIYKWALDIGKPDLPSKVLTHWPTAYIDQTMNMVAPAISLKTYVDPDEEEHNRVAKAIDKASPQALSTTKLRYGGYDAIDDVLWKKDTPKGTPWYGKLGGRVLHNPRTGPLGKVLGYASYGPSYLAATLGRSPHYNAQTDTIVNMYDLPSVTSHELGHAMDFNKHPVPDKPGFEGSLERMAAGTKRDLYGMGYGVPFANLYYESEANRLSREALEKTWGGKKDEDKLHKIMTDRVRHLSPAYGSYLGAAGITAAAMAAKHGMMDWKTFSKLPLPLMAAGVLGGKAYGWYKGRKMDREHEERKKKDKKDQEKESMDAVVYNLARVAAMQKVAGAASFVDPVRGIIPGKNRLQELARHAASRNSPDIAKGIVRRATIDRAYDMNKINARRIEDLRARLAGQGGGPASGGSVGAALSRAGITANNVGSMF